jgi:hypothetical protein
MLRVALPQDESRIQVDQICGLAVDREVRLRVRSQPQVRKVEVIEVGRRRCGCAVQIEGDSLLAFGRHEAARHQTARDQGDGEKECETVAPAPLASARPWVAV